MPMVYHNGTNFEVDDDGFFAAGMDNWGDDWATYVKHAEGVTDLTDELEKVIKTMQKYYSENGIAPMVRILFKVTGVPLKVIHGFSQDGLRMVYKMAGFSSLEAQRAGLCL